MTLSAADKWPWLTAGFRRYTRRYLARSFHAVHLVGQFAALNDDGRTPLLVCLNHSSWWDVLVPFFVESELFGWDLYGVMDARQLARYRIFAHMGMIGVERSSLAGAREFLRFSETLLKDQRRALWLTPQGEMVSNARRPIRFQPGLGHLAARLGRFYLIHIALHYEFWNERLPEAFVRVSEAALYDVAPGALSPRSFVRDSERALERELDALLAAVEGRDSSGMRTLLAGGAGTSPTYDAFRALIARLQGRRLEREHGRIVTPSWKGRHNDRD
jgi:1-acyl-sn-glycerol-3-phosphate acyltransferase